MEYLDRILEFIKMDDEKKEKAFKYAIAEKLDNDLEDGKTLDDLVGPLLMEKEFFTDRGHYRNFYIFQDGDRYLVKEVYQVPSVVLGIYPYFYYIKEEQYNKLSRFYNENSDFVTESLIDEVINKDEVEGCSFPLVVKGFTSYPTLS